MKLYYGLRLVGWVYLSDLRLKIEFILWFQVGWLGIVVCLDVENRVYILVSC
jgi:hypothetical protein